MASPKVNTPSPPPPAPSTPPSAQTASTGAQSAANYGDNAKTVATSQANASADMAAQDALAQIARQMALNEAKNSLIKKGGDGMKAGI
jgi:hypothetical protein